MYLCKFTATGCNLRHRKKTTFIKETQTNELSLQLIAKVHSDKVYLFWSYLKCLEHVFQSPECFLQSTFDQRDPLQHLQQVSLTFGPSCSHLCPELLLEVGVPG